MNSYDKLYIRPYGSTQAFQEFPYKIDGVNTLPEHDVSANDVDLDAYTNTNGYTIRNRQRHDVATLEFNVPTMSGEELHELFDMTTNVWLECRFFYEPAWNFVKNDILKPIGKGLKWIWDHTLGWVFKKVEGAVDASNAKAAEKKAEAAAEAAEDAEDAE
jgi:hypothetical protein